MERAVRQNLIITSFSLFLIGILLTGGMWLLYPDSPDRVGLALLSAMICICIMTLTGKHLERIAEHPIHSWILLSVYLILGIMLCFPNAFVSRFALYFVIVIPVAAFLGNTFAISLLLGTMLLQILLRGPETEIILQFFCAVISCINVSMDHREGGRKTVFFALFPEAALILLYGTLRSEDGFWANAFIMLGLMAVTMLLSVYMKQKSKLLWDAFDYSLFDEPEAPAVPEKLTLDSDKDVTCYTLSELCSRECTYQKVLHSSLPKTYTREVNTAELARKVAGIAGADTEFVYCAVLYRILLKIKPENQSAEDFVASLKLQDSLKAFILKASMNGWRPSNFEEIIAYTACELVSTYNYLKKQNAEVSVEQLTESVCTLLLQKKIVRDCLLSMSLFHRMKHGFMDNLAEYVGVK